MPRLSATIPKLKHSLAARKFLLRNSSGLPNSYNIVTFKHTPTNSTLIGCNDDYYRQLHTNDYLFEYRFINPTLDNQLDTTRWQALPGDNLTEFLLHDTLQGLDSYAGVWFQDILLQTRVMPCPDTILTCRFTIYPQGQNNTNGYMSSINDNSESPHYDSCGHHRGHIHCEQVLRELYTFHFVFSCLNAPDSLNCTRDHGYTLPESIPSVHDGMKLHNYITLPVHCRAINLSADSVITTTTLTNLQYAWGWTWPTIPELDGDSILIEVVDDKECPLFTKIPKYDYYLGIFDLDDLYTPFEWTSWMDNEHRYCPDATHSIGLYQFYGTNTGITIDGHWSLTYKDNIVRLIESPNDNAYNFEAIATQYQTWSYTKAHPEQEFDVTFFCYPYPFYWDMPGVKLTANGLPNGRYVWEVVYPCDRPNDTIVQNVEYTKVPEWNTPFTYQFKPQCDRLAIVPTSGQLGYKDSLFTTYFDIRADGDPAHSINAITSRDTLYAGVIGDYLLGAYALPEGNPALLNDNSCYIFDSILVWDGNFFMFDYLYSYVCNAADSIGFVRARGKKGSLPYTYRLFDHPNGAGLIIG